MQNNHRNGSCTLFARGFVALCAVLAMGLGFMARPAPAAPFAYVANADGNLSVIDTAANPPVVVATVGVRGLGVAVTPDGKHAYGTDKFDSIIALIDTATNTVVSTVTVGTNPIMSP
jgi:YVTN family beta-propeller protein